MKGREWVDGEPDVEKQKGGGIGIYALLNPNSGPSFCQSIQYRCSDMNYNHGTL